MNRDDKEGGVAGEEHHRLCGPARYSEEAQLSLGS